MKLENFLVYPATFTQDGSGYIVRFKDIENSITEGSSYSDAINMAQDWLIGYFEICSDQGKAVKEASQIQSGDVPIVIPPIIAFKAMIKNAMIKCGMNQKQLAEANGMSQQTLSTLLSYKRLNSRMDTLIKVAQSVGLRLSVTDEN